MTLVSERSAASRRRLLEAAAAELIARGGTAEVAAVAARSGASVGLIYRHFGSKAGLIAAVVEDFYDRLDDSVLNADLTPGADWPVRERLRTRRNAAFHYAEPLAPVILSRLAREPEVAAVEARRIARHIEAAARNIRRAQKNGEIPADLDPELAAAMVLGGIRQALGAVLARAAPPPQDTVVDELWRFVAAAIRCAPVSPKGEALCHGL